MSETYCNEYRGVQYDALVHQWPKGFVLELKVRIEGVPDRRFTDQVFESRDEAVAFGEAEAKRIIDQLKGSGAA
ncbi:hypothetical protein [Pseudomonas abyssi]|uniref:hypothetical protein n=1 Tax=Pseudomonas abyssi TaxID=170540 RepID=UPI003C7E3C01